MRQIVFTTYCYIVDVGTHLCYTYSIHQMIIFTVLIEYYFYRFNFYVFIYLFAQLCLASVVTVGWYTGAQQYFKNHSSFF